MTDNMTDNMTDSDKTFKSVHWGLGQSSTPDYDAAPGLQPLPHCRERPAPAKGISKASRPIDDEMYQKNMWNMVQILEEERDHLHGVVGAEFEGELDYVLEQAQETMERHSKQAYETMMKEWQSQVEHAPALGKRRLSVLTPVRSGSNASLTQPTVTRSGRIEDQKGERTPISYRVKKDYSAAKIKYPVRRPCSPVPAPRIETLAERLRKLPIDGRSTPTSSPTPVSASRSSSPLPQTGPRGERRRLLQMSMREVEEESLEGPS